MRYAKLILINFAVLVSILIASEIILRVVWTIKSCNSRGCNFARLNSTSVRKTIDHSLRFTALDGKLGYIPKAGFDDIVKVGGWPNVRVTIDKNGYRKNDNNENFQNKILVVGDSFTFGDQVSNYDTWPSCLERTLKIGTINAGVFGYGAAQAVKRAEIALSKHNYETVILSVLLTHDFSRDRLDYRDGFPRPAIAYVAGKLDWASVPSSRERGSKWGIRNTVSFQQRLLKPFWQYSQLLAPFIDRINVLGLDPIDFTGRRLSRVHPYAANIDQIIQFTIDRLSALQTKKKILFLQYTEHEIRKRKQISLREKVTHIARQSNIQVIDTYDHLKETQANTDILLWNDHHTPNGNKIVCDYLVSQFNRVDQFHK